MAQPLRPVMFYFDDSEPVQGYTDGSFSGKGFRTALLTRDAGQRLMDLINQADGSGEKAGYDEWEDVFSIIWEQYVIDDTFYDDHRIYAPVLCLLDGTQRELYRFDDLALIDEECTSNA